LPFTDLGLANGLHTAFFAPHVFAIALPAAKHTRIISCVWWRASAQPWRHFSRGANIVWQKLKFVIYSFWNL